MKISLGHSGELLELILEGVLDNDSSAHFREAIDDAIHDGWHRILVHFGGVSYLSSAGISALLHSKSQLEALHGLFGICDPAAEVQRVLRQTQVLDGLLRDPETVRAGAATGTMTRMSQMRAVSGDGVDLQVYRLETETDLVCRLFGGPAPLAESAYTESDCRRVEFPRSTIGLGLGAFGESFQAAQPRFSEFLAVAGTAAQSPVTGGSVPDYVVARGDLTPDAHIAYGAKCDGDFSHLVRFESSDPAQSVPLSTLVSQTMRAIDCQAAAVVVIAECAGLVGTQLRQSPAELVGSTGGPSRFSFPEVRDWLSFSVEQIHRRSLVVAVGLAASGSESTLAAAESFLRPMNDEDLTGHFHCAVFPYQPLKKRTLDLATSASDLFETGSIQDVLHLLRDDRPIKGAGESEFVSGACWIGPIREIIVEESGK